MGNRTSTQKISLASDNCSPVHPSVIQAIIEANDGYAISYGGDFWTEQVEALFEEAFQRKVKTLLVPSGTGSNVLALKLGCKRHESVLCSDIAHILTAESGAAESVVGVKLISIFSENGKIYPAEVVKKIKQEKLSGKHATFPRVLSITQSTEVGTVYTLDEIKELKKLCNREHLLLHMDGSRLYNAATYLNAPLSELAQHVDLLSLGGTKNGLAFAEALLIFNKDLQEGCEHQQKQSLLLVSKMRYIAAQFLALFRNNLWEELASGANEKAKEIGAIVQANPAFRITSPIETNQIFFTAPKELIPYIQENISSYVWNEEIGELRFVTSWNTTPDEVERVRGVLKELK